MRFTTAQMKKEYIIEEIRRTAEANGGRPLGRQRFLAETGIRETDWSGKFWTKWSDAVREAGLEPNMRQTAFDAGHLLAQLASLVRGLGHYPVVAELRIKAREDSDFPSHNTFRRFGGKAEQAEALVSWCSSHSGWDDVRELAAPIAAAAETRGETQTESGPEPEFGYVYLLKSGKYYKIGRSTAPGRREYEVAIQLPEPVSTVHTIKTDDPVGIEKYWHQRFADRRRNGEWFELRSADLTAFRRRKFM